MARWQNQPNTEKREQVISLRMSGMTYKQIANAIGHKNESWVMTVCRENGLGGTSAWKDKRYAEMREYKAQGHTNAEVAELFGISAGTATMVCKGIAPQKPDYAKVSNTLRNRVRTETRKKTEERLKDVLPDCFEYVGGYDGSAGYVTIRCKDCGAEFERSVQAIRKKQVKYCPVCRERETKNNREERELIKNAKRIERETAREERLKQAEAERKEKTAEKTCVVCGRTFETVNQRARCCSEECSRKYANHHRDRRIPKDKRISYGINAKSLFKRDDGTCWICGGKCNLNDYVIRDGTFIAGDWYPSVDHVVAICDGGEDSWNNVKLAHRICNTRRYYAEKNSPDRSRA